MFRILAATLVFGLYISYRSYRAFFSKYKIWLAMPPIFAAAELFVIVRVAAHYIGFDVPDWLSSLSYIFLGLFIYLFFYFLLFDILRILRIRIGFFQENGLRQGIAVLLLAGATFLYGYWHQFQTVVKTYDFTFSKPPSAPFRIAALSDVHIGSGMTAKRLSENVDVINSYKPHMVLIAGDIIDNDLKDFTEDFRKELRRLEAPLGVYAVLGNHEYYSGPADKVTASLEEAGMKVLKDEVVYFPDYGFYLLGRDSIRHSASNGKERKPIEELKNLIEDETRPLIIMDHIPMNTEDGRKARAQLQISGHTHGGQFFPVTQIVKLFYPVSRGVLREGDFNLLVSSGFGLWGPPMRIGSDSEILILNIK